MATTRPVPTRTAVARVWEGGDADDRTYLLHGLIEGGLGQNLLSNRADARSHDHRLQVRSGCGGGLVSRLRTGKCDSAENSSKTDGREKEKSATKTIGFAVGLHVGTRGITHKVAFLRRWRGLAKQTDHCMRGLLRR